MIVKLLTEQHLEFLSLKGDCTDSSKSTHVKMPHFCKSHALALLEMCYLSRLLMRTVAVDRKHLRNRNIHFKCFQCCGY